MDYKDGIKNATQKTQLSYGELRYNFYSLWGTKIRKYNGPWEISATLLYSTICPNAGKVLNGIMM